MVKLHVLSFAGDAGNAGCVSPHIYILSLTYFTPCKKHYPHYLHYPHLTIFHLAIFAWPSMPHCSSFMPSMMRSLWVRSQPARRRLFIFSAHTICRASYRSGLVLTVPFIMPSRLAATTSAQVAWPLGDTARHDSNNIRMVSRSGSCWRNASAALSGSAMP